MGVRSDSWAAWGRGLVIVVAAALSACAFSKPPSEIVVGHMGRVLTEPEHQGTRIEGRSLTWLKWNATAMLDGFSQPPTHIRMLRSSPAARAESRASFTQSRNAIFWIGHSTFLLKVDGVTILTDPVFADRATPLHPLGPRRYIPAALKPEALPPIDVILVSHSHYDHMDVSAINRIIRSQPAVAVLVPKHAERLLRTPAIGYIRGFDPGESLDLKTVTFTAFPAYHTSSRFGFDAGRSPALTWSMRPKHANPRTTDPNAPSVFFAGDTGYGQLFSRIRKVYGPHDIAIVPIGAYAPRAHERHAHVNPEEALRLAQDLGAGLAIPAHWGTFPLSREPTMEPIMRFMRAPGPSRLWLRVGQAFSFDAQPQAKATPHLAQATYKTNKVVR